MKRVKYLLILSVFILIMNCEEKITPPVHDNIYDPKYIYGDDIPPIASFTVSPDSGITNETVFGFDASSSIEEDIPQTKLLFRCDFDGNGSWDTDWSFQAKETYKYSKGGGVKTVKLIVKGMKSLTRETSRLIFVNTRPVAAFAWGYDQNDPMIIKYDASASSDYEDGSNLQFRWDFDGDGAWDTGWQSNPNASHQFGDFQTVTTRLQVKDSTGLTVKASEDVKNYYYYKDMAYVPAGSFQMGSNDSDAGYNEKPVHTVYVDGFWIDKYEVTNAKYAAYLNEALAAGEIQASSSTVTKDGYELLDLGDSDCQISYTGGRFVVDSGKEDYPVIEVTWYGAKAFADHYDKRLPTEAEWEYAARGGPQSQGYKYSGGNNVDEVAWYSSNSGGHTHPVGLKQANELGLYDMSGNVWEWCADWYDSGYYSVSPTNNPPGPSSGSRRVIRGGSWGGDARRVRCANRYGYDPSISNSDVGFRLAKD